MSVAILPWIVDASADTFEAEITARFETRGIPLLVRFRQGEEVDRFVGAAPQQRLREWLARYLAPPSASG